MRRDLQLSRRACLGAAASLGAAALWAPSRSWAAGPDPRVLAIVKKTLAIDTHNHIDVALFPDILPQPDIDMFGAMKQSGLAAVCTAFAVDYQAMVNPSDWYKRFINGLNSMDAQLKRNHMQRSYTSAEVRAAFAKGQPTVIQAVEGGHWLEGQVGRLEEAYGRGLRHMGLLHDHDAAPPLGDTNTHPAGLHGLTQLGADVIRKCNQLGILVDLAHCSEETTTAALKVSKTPMLFSHTGLNTRLDDDPEIVKAVFGKLVSKEQAKAIADAGGVIGVWTHISPTSDAYGQNIRAMVDVVGVDHVCIGTDAKITPALGIGGGPGILPKSKSIGILIRDTFPNEENGFLYVVVDGLLKAGFNAEEIGKICGGNYLRIFNTAVSGKA